ncbi:hypothetical protein KDH_28500 [Dictyobacter sp. S3.2.2.5]|uniref:Putative zinc-finger domain-containing protein n=1 Tax=Dictyobacter halimunensis TaxID=3026934 RepID=A0ABQ6FU62_9CHLR|nr:hypothetical protein KDH_28500 [Dictyobacter sp. S3.2.2.5]
MENWFKRFFRHPTHSTHNKNAIDKTNSTQGLACREVVELVSDYLEGVLVSELRAQLEQHLEECPGCMQYLEQVRLTISMLRNLALEPVFPATKAELVQVFRQWKQD